MSILPHRFCSRFLLSFCSLSVTIFPSCLRCLSLFTCVLFYLSSFPLPFFFSTSSLFFLCFSLLLLFFFLFLSLLFSFPFFSFSISSTFLYHYLFFFPLMFVYMFCLFFFPPILAQTCSPLLIWLLSKSFVVIGTLYKWYLFLSKTNRYFEHRYYVRSSWTRTDSVFGLRPPASSIVIRVLLWITWSPPAQEIWGNGACRSVVAGNAQAQVVSDIVFPLAEWLLLTIAGETPQNSLLPQWPSIWAKPEEFANSAFTLN